VKETKQQRQTKLNELVETHNLYLSIHRLRSSPYDSEKWKRALYHALAMENVGNRWLEKIRVALELP